MSLTHRALGLLAPALSLTLLLAAAVPSVSAAPVTPTLVEVRAAHHPGFDRIVFEFEGGLPQVTSARWATDLRLDGSGQRAHVQGSAFLRVLFRWATAHQEQPPAAPTYGPARRAFDLPNIAHVVLLGDYEGYVTFGIGLMKRTRILHTYRLHRPSRYVIDIGAGFAKARVPVYLFDEPAYASGEPPFFVPVARTVPANQRARGAMQRLYAGPTLAEREDALRLVRSGTRGFRDLRVNSRGVARVTLIGPCDGRGAAEANVAGHIMRTLKARPAIRWVKIHDRFGQTLQPWGRSDSIPACLEP